MDGLERFGEKLRALRKHHNVTLHWLATQLGYATHSYISEIESGQKSPTVTFVLKVSYLFGVTTDQLLKDELELEIEQSQIRNSQ
ncbi:MAG: helix-turn-helix transcriptional regulator [Caldilineaceae bacterium]|nr:helix-turn-helix transcriptional regulator [Caldilineaceae bacterium]